MNAHSAKVLSCPAEALLRFEYFETTSSERERFYARRELSTSVLFERKKLEEKLILNHRFCCERQRVTRQKKRPKKIAPQVLVPRV
jgi:hypothetical protein